MADGLRLVVWDLDGTIVDSRKIIQEAMEDAFRKCDLPPPAYEQTRKIVGLSLEEGCSMLAPPGTSPNLISHLCESYKQAFVDNRKVHGFKEPLYEGAVELLEALANENCLMAVATGKSHRGIEVIFEMHDLGRYFDTVWCADDGPGKPHPFMVEEAMKAMGCECHETLMVGDAIHDIHMGVAAGVITHGVTWGFGHRSELIEAGAHHLHDEMPALHEALLGFARS